MKGEPKLWSARDLPIEDVAPYAEKFARNLAPANDADCWFWNGSLNPAGYGRFCIGYGKDGNRHVFAHRASWVLHTGRDLPGDLSIDHLCEIRACVNPSHLEPVSIHENRRRATTREEPNVVERRVQELIAAAPLGRDRNGRGMIHRVCGLCDVPYPTDYLADHIRRHIEAGPRYRGRRVRPRDGSAWNANECPDCGVIISGHMRRHRMRMHEVA